LSTKPCYLENRRLYSRNPSNCKIPMIISTLTAFTRMRCSSVVPRSCKPSLAVCRRSLRSDLILTFHVLAQLASPITTPDGGCLGVVLRTGFGTAQGQLVRTMIFSTDRVSANNVESFLFIGFLLIFAIAASWYVWTKGAYDYSRS